jgi:hypothetical protein
MITSTDHREQMMKTTKLIRSDTDDLRDAAALASNTVEVAIDTSREINEQGEKLRGMRDRVRDFTHFLT